MTTKTRTRKPRTVARTTAGSRKVSLPAMGIRRVLVATDGSDAAQAALKLARWMEQTGRWSPEVMTVLEPVPVSMAEIAFAAPSPEYQQVVTDSLLNRIAKQIKKYGNESWKLGVQFGRVAPSIVEFARERDVSLIVLGLGKHGKLARMFGAETAGRVARLSSTPVLAVDAHARGAPRTALVAVDFGKSSVRAAAEALRLLERPARLHLLHVRWAFEGHTMRDAEWERTYADGVDVAFARLLDDLGPQPGVRITSEMRLGSVIETTLDVAKKIGADLLAAGSHNQNVVDRLLIGSTPAHLLRAAHCSVLVASPADA